MPESFRDIDAWETLSDPEAEAGALRAALEGLGRAKAKERAVFRGCLIRLANHPDADVRALSLRGLCGIVEHAGFECVHPQLCTTPPPSVARVFAVTLRQTS